MGVLKKTMGKRIKAYFAAFLISGVFLFFLASSVTFSDSWLSPKSDSYSYTVETIIRTLSPALSSLEQSVSLDTKKLQRTFETLLRLLSLVSKNENNPLTKVSAEKLNRLFVAFVAENHSIEQLKKGHPEQRIEAANALGEIATPESIEALIQALVDKKSIFVCIAAIESLGKIGRQAEGTIQSTIITALLEALEGTYIPVHLAVIESLKNIGQKTEEKNLSKIESALFDRFENSSWLVRVAILKTLLDTRGPKTLLALFNQTPSEEPKTFDHFNIWLIKLGFDPNDSMRITNAVFYPKEPELPNADIVVIAKNKPFVPIKTIIAKIAGYILAQDWLNLEIYVQQNFPAESGPRISIADFSA
jgi:hypothetical protein